MLSEQARTTVEATLPAVADNIEEIARRFYAHMFEARPDLMDGLFNRGNQAQGSQQVALAGSVAAFATAVLQDQLPEQLLMRISHKHVSLGLRPDQYQLVHDHLFWAIADVLGDAVTPEVVAGWDEVYWLMTEVLTSQERGLYSAHGVRPETVWRDWVVVEKRRETDDVVTFVVRRKDGRPAKTSLPGQYVSVQALMPDGLHQPRQYSLTRADDGDHRQFTVKRVHGAGSPDGEVSTLLHESVDVGHTVTMSLPSGNVVLEDSGRPLVLISAGTGIGPMAGMLSHLVATGSSTPVVLLHADAGEGSFALRHQVAADVRALPDASVHLWFEDGAGSTLPVDGVHAGLLDMSQVRLPDGAVHYLCGPLPFMKAVRAVLLERGVAAHDIEYEVFGPDLWQADDGIEPAPSAAVLQGR